MARTRRAPLEEEEVKLNKAVEDAKEIVQEATPVPSLPKWQFIGGGTLQLKDGQLIDSGSFFFADPSVISTAFMDLMRLIEPGEVKPKYEDNEILDVQMVKREDGLFDIQAGDTVLNEAPLQEGDANNFIASLTSE
jgi:hypothetical protein